MKSVVMMKFWIKDSGVSRVPMPRGAEIVSAGLQKQGCVVWAKCDADAAIVPHDMMIVATGDKFPPMVAERPMKHIGTLPVRMQTPKGVAEVIIHVFDLGESLVIANLNG